MANVQRRQGIIAVAGIGYVGLSNAVMLAQHNQVVAIDILPERVELLNNRQSPIADAELEYHLAHEPLQLSATTEGESIYCDADYLLVATPTNYDPERNYFDTSSVESVLEAAISANPEIVCVIKSTIPIGFTRKMCKKFRTDRILFSPEFLREGQALHDCLHPNRIIVGASPSARHHAEAVAQLLLEGAQDSNVPVLQMNSDEAEATKLFANSYLAMRVSFFNELDTFAELKGLQASDIIAGISLDNRIGDYFNNPSFGYGGYCFPKDTKQLLADYADIDNSIIEAIVSSNAMRKRHIVQQILSREPKTVGIYRLAMKSGSDNFRQSAVLDVMDGLAEAGVRIVVYEPSCPMKAIQGADLMNDFREFCTVSDVIVANRWDELLRGVSDKVYTRDVYMRD